MITFNNIGKTYSDGTKALDGLNGSFFPSSLGVVLGDNGAGKTTLLKILVDVLHPTEGEVEVNFIKPVGYMGQDSGNSFYEILTVFENFQFFSKLNNISITKEQLRKKLEYFNIEDIISTKFYKLSGGQKQILSFIRAFLHKPKLIILDEPFANISPDKVALLCGYIIEYIRDNDSLIVLSSHSLENISMYFDFVYYIVDKKGYYLTNDFIKPLFERSQIIDIIIDEEYVNDFTTQISSNPNILYQHIKGKYSQTLVSVPNYKLEENTHYKIVNVKKPSLTDLSLLLKIPAFIKQLLEFDEK